MKNILDLVIGAVAIWLGVRYLAPILRWVYGPQFTEGRPDVVVLVRGIAFLPFALPLRLIDVLIRRYIEPKAFRR